MAGSRAAAAVARSAGKPVWAVVGVGRLLPTRMWDALVDRVTPSGRTLGPRRGAGAGRAGGPGGRRAGPRVGRGRHAPHRLPGRARAAPRRLQPRVRTHVPSLEVGWLGTRWRRIPNPLRRGGRAIPCPRWTRPLRSSATSSSGCGSAATSTAWSTPTTARPTLPSAGRGRAGPAAGRARRRRPPTAGRPRRRSDGDLDAAPPALAARPGRRPAHDAPASWRASPSPTPTRSRRATASARSGARGRARRRPPRASTRSCPASGPLAERLHRLARGAGRAARQARARRSDSLADDFRERTDRAVRPARRRARRLRARDRQAVVGLQLLPGRAAQPGRHQHRPAGAVDVARPPRRPRGLSRPPHRAHPQGGRPGPPARPAGGDDLPRRHAAVPARRGPGRPRPRGARAASGPSRSLAEHLRPLGIPLRRRGRRRGRRRRARRSAACGATSPCCCTTTGRRRRRRRRLRSSAGRSCRRQPGREGRAVPHRPDLAGLHLLLRRGPAALPRVRRRRPGPLRAPAHRAAAPRRPGRLPPDPRGPICPASADALSSLPAHGRTGTAPGRRRHAPRRCA